LTTGSNPGMVWTFTSFCGAIKSLGCWIKIYAVVSDFFYWVSFISFSGLFKRQ
jgi:hypothetical protein